MNRWIKVVGAGLVVAALAQWGYPIAFEAYTGVENRPLTYASSQEVSDAAFETLAQEVTFEARLAKAQGMAAHEKDEFARRIKTNLAMTLRSTEKAAGLPHINYFREAGIRQYEGPKTCLSCHETMKVNGKSINTLEDVADSIHFTFQKTEAGFSTYGYDGRQVNGPGTRPIPVGKIDRACGVPGSFSWTGWADIVEAKPAHHAEGIEKRSEGCGQCHIGGGYHPATEKMLPLHDVPDTAKQGIDCLICHAPNYDMNQRYVIEDEGGMRWNQDRSLKTAMSVGLPTAKTCLFCHQHNLGGDQEKNLNVGSAPDNLGHANKRLLHPGSKRGTSVMPSKDVHAAAGLICTDCHVPEGHKIPRGTKGVDLVANDLPDKEVTCEGCHTAAPHVKGKNRAILNGHGDRIACETCHITHLEADNVVLRDWLHPVWNDEEGVFVFTDLYQSGEVNKGFKFFWFNGNGTFLANALGDNPTGGGEYQPLMAEMAKITDPEALAEIRKNAEKVKEHYPDLDLEKYIREATDPLSQLSPEMLAKRKEMLEKNLRKIMRQGKSKIYPFKVFNALMYEDMSNQGPFGAMILPFDYPTYYETGDPMASMKKAVANPIVKRMYQAPFTLYMMDEFMAYFGVDKWSKEYPLTKDGEVRNVEGHWMRQMGTLMLNHGIKAKGRSCDECHGEKGIIDFKALGYPPERIKDLRNLPELG